MELVFQAVDCGARRTAACALLGISVRTLQRWSGQGGTEDRRCAARGGPANRLSEAEKERIVSIATSAEFQDASAAVIVPTLADQGMYVASESSFYRVLRDRKMNEHRGPKAPRSHHRPSAYLADGPNQVWSWDITYLRSTITGMFFYLYMILDIWSRKIVGWAVHEAEDNRLAARLVGEAAMREQVDAARLVLHSDNGAPMKGATMAATLQRLGVIPSFARPRVPDDNPYSEALYATMKTRPEYPARPFDGRDAAEQWVATFVSWYNHQHLHSAIRFVTPADRHSGREWEILNNRKEVYRRAKQRHPSRWTGNTRNWNPVETVRLNPETTPAERTDQRRVTA